MRFTIVYNYGDKNLRQQIGQMIVQNAKNGFKFDEQEITTPFFRTLLEYPDIEKLKSIPFNLQVEEVEYKKGKLISRKILMIEVEVEKTEMIINPLALVKIRKK